MKVILFNYLKLNISSFCVDRKKKQERTANTLRRRTNGPFGVWLRNSRLRRSNSPRPRRPRKASFVTDGSRYRSPSKHPAFKKWTSLTFDIAIKIFRRIFIFDFSSDFLRSNHLLPIEISSTFVFVIADIPCIFFFLSTQKEETRKNREHPATAFYLFSTSSFFLNSDRFSSSSQLR